MAKSKVKEQSGEEKSKTLSQIQALLDKHKGHHYNDHETEKEIQIPTGSLVFDLALEGGLTSGIVRFAGPKETGKTSAALSIAAKFQKEHKNGMVIYIKSEGRLTRKMVDRSGLDTSEEKFFILKTNVFEVAFEFVRDLTLNNPDKKKYFFIIDSADALNLKADVAKGFDEPDKVAGGALLNSIFLKKLALPIGEFGHILAIMSQVRIKLPQGYNQTAKQQNAGGNAVEHYSNFIFDFKERYINDYFWENPNSTSPDKRGNPIGHWCKIEFKKSENEKTGSTVRYPIKYGRTGGKSIWVERELIELLSNWGYIEKSASWLNFDETLENEMEKAGLQKMGKLQGESKVLDWLEQNEKERDWLFSFIKERILNA